MGFLRNEERLVFEGSCHGRQNKKESISAQGTVRRRTLAERAELKSPTKRRSKSSPRAARCRGAVPRGLARHARSQRAGLRLKLPANHAYRPPAVRSPSAANRPEDGIEMADTTKPISAPRDHRGWAALQGFNRLGASGNGNLRHRPNWYLTRTRASTRFFTRNVERAFTLVRRDGLPCTTGALSLGRTRRVRNSSLSQRWQNRSCLPNRHTNRSRLNWGRERTPSSPPPLKLLS